MSLEDTLLEFSTVVNGEVLMAAPRKRYDALAAELSAIEKALPHLLGFRMYPMFDAKGTFSQEKANEWSKRVGDFHAALQRPGVDHG